MWTYDDDERGRLVATDGKAQKVLPDEVTAYIYCAQRNETLPERGPDEKGQNYRARLRDWAYDQLVAASIEPIEAEAEPPPAVIDEAILAGGAASAIAAIEEAAPSPDEADALIEVERSRKRPRATVIDALEARTATGDPE